MIMKMLKRVAHQLTGLGSHLLLLASNISSKLACFKKCKCLYAVASVIEMSTNCAKDQVWKTLGLVVFLGMSMIFPK